MTRLVEACRSRCTRLFSTKDTATRGLGSGEHDEFDDLRLMLSNGFLPTDWVLRALVMCLRQGSSALQVVLKSVKGESTADRLGLVAKCIIGC